MGSIISYFNSKEFKKYLHNLFFKLLLFLVYCFVIMVILYKDATIYRWWVHLLMVALTASTMWFTYIFYKYKKIKFNNE